MKLISVDQWKKRYFGEDSAPADQVVRRLLRQKRIPGAKKVGGTWYVDADEWEAEGGSVRGPAATDDGRPTVRVVLHPGATGYVYVIQQGPRGPLKIGFTAESDVSRRFADLQTASPAKLYLRYVFQAERAVERRIHRALARHRLEGEWFRNGRLLQAFLKKLAERGAPCS